MAGTGANGFSGDGGPALLANINLPRGPRTDAAGNVFFADEGNNRIRRLTPSPAITVTPTSFSFPAGGGANYLLVNSPSSSWTAASNVSWIVITGSNKTPGAGTLQFNVDANPNPESRTGAINIDGVIVTVAQEGTESSANSPVRFVPVTPCRVLDSRTEGGKSGAFGPPVLSADSTRDIPVPSSNCGIPSSAKAYSLNVTVVPAEGLGYLSLWPTGKQQPVVSTLNSPAGKVVANAAIVPAGVNGAISVYVTNRTHLILDINGYFTAATSTEALSFYTTTPCRALETRIAYRAAGPLGAPSLTGGVARDFPLSSSPCGVPSTAKAYSVNATVVPPGPLSYLTVWPTGITQPLVSTLNSFDGRVVANAAIVPAGTAGNVSVFATNNTDLLLDVNGYFAPPAANALSFVPVTPCRVADTRDGQGFDGLFGPPVMAAGAIRSFPIPLGRCSIPSTANAYSLNITVVPHGGLPYLSIWPGGQAQPVVSTLNSFDGSIVANAALVPAGSGGGVNIYVANTTDVIIDINGYFTQ